MDRSSVGQLPSSVVAVRQTRAKRESILYISEYLLTIDQSLGCTCGYRERHIERHTYIIQTGDSEPPKSLSGIV
jgi:hypothetical protein